MGNKCFLELVSEDLHKVFDGKYADVTVVFPNKRASLFMNDYLAKYADGSSMWAPEYTTISELFEGMSDLAVADSMYLVCRLYQAYRECTGSDESFDHFYAWGELMLSDFDDIDSNMVDAEHLFTNIVDMENLTVSDYLSESQIEALQQFFRDFNPRHSDDDRLFPATIRKNFSSVWNHLNEIYSLFRKKIGEEGKCYPGMLKRSVIDKMKGNVAEAASVLKTGNYVVVGFNVLNETEKLMFKFLKQNRNTMFYWDYDVAYLNSDVGMFIRENIQLFGNQFAGRDVFNNMRSEVKNVTFISSPTEDAQSRYVRTWLGQEGVTADRSSAVVLCNENILNSVLHSIPAKIDGKDISLNITMGFPLADAPVYSFVCALLDLQVHGRTSSGNWRYQLVANVLKHPYTKRLAEKDTVKCLKDLHRQSMMFPSDSFFEKYEELPSIFKYCESPHDITAYLSGLVERVAMCDDVSAIFAESVFSAYTMINRLGTIQETMPEFKVNRVTYSRLLRQLMRGGSAPFHGEPAIGLQVMGFLETRNLDFDNVILLSANEGQLPRVSQNNSFIPYTLRQAYGMTTIEKATNLYAYYFYRLIQRARNVTLMFNCSAEGLVKGEKSRFMMQLQVEADELFAEGTRIELKTLTSDKDIVSLPPFEVRSSRDIVNILRHRFDLAFEKNPDEYLTLLSPSALNSFISCRRQFFYKYVARLKVDKEMTDEVDASTFGTIFHRCMEKIYEPYTGRQIQSGELFRLANDKEKIEGLVDEAFAVVFFKHEEGDPVGNLPYNGSQLLDKHVLINQIQAQIKYDARFCPFTILKVEDKQYEVITIETPKDKIRVRIGGIIDRYDLVDDAVFEPGSCQKRIRVVDYKTSRSMQSCKELGELFTDSKDRSGYIFQTLYYCESLADSVEYPIYPHLMYVNKPLGKRESSVEIGKMPVRDYVKEYRKDYMTLLRGVISDIFDERTDFSMTEVKEHCAYCDFAELCKRNE